MPTATFNFEEISTAARAAIQDAFPNSAISIEEGWHGRVHMKVVSEAFNGQSEDLKQKMVWQALRNHLNEASAGIALVLVYGLDEI